MSCLELPKIILTCLVVTLNLKSIEEVLKGVVFVKESNP